MAMEDPQPLEVSEYLVTEHDIKKLPPAVAPLIVTHSSLRMSSEEEMKPVLPADLVDSESDAESDGSSTAYRVPNPEEVHFQSDQQSDDTYAAKQWHESEKVKKLGRWSLGKGAAKKPSKSKDRVISEIPLSKDSDSFGELSRLQVHSETQRILREAEMRLQEHRPKQFKRFSDFRQSLHGTSLVGSQTSTETVASAADSGSATVRNQPADLPSLEPCNSADVLIENSSLPDLLATNTEVITDQSADIRNEISHAECQTHISAVLNQQPKAKRILDLLPTTLPPPNCPNEDDEGFIDLGESAFPSKSSGLTLADQLLARFKEHTRPPPVRKESGPIEYTVITKTVDEVDGSDRLRLESVTHEVTQAPESEVLLHSNNSQRRKFWKRHRELLKEQMRQKRLEQYEARMKEQELETGQKQCETNADGKALSDDDTEWSEEQEVDEEDLSTDESESSSSDTLTETEAETDVDDVPIKSSRSKRSCAFADDEAEESEHNADQEIGDDENSGDSDSESDAVISSRSSESEDTNDGEAADLHPVEFQCEDLGQSRNEDHSRFEKLLNLHDFTDLPGHPTEVVEETVSTENYSLTSGRRPQGSLGPGDVDLFMSDYSTILDRTTNAASVLASTRLDNSMMIGRQKSLEVSIPSQWNDTPYELLYSQKLASQSSLSKDQSQSTDNTVVSSTATSRLSQSDTVLLSQISTCDLDPESTLKLPSSCSDSVQASQDEHCRRHQLFSKFSQLGGVSIQTGAVEAHMNALDDTVHVESAIQDSQQVHINRRELFASSERTFTESLNRTSVGSQTPDRKDSQSDQDKFHQLFDSSEQSVASYSDHKSPVGQTSFASIMPDDFCDLAWNGSNVQFPSSSVDSQVSQAQHDLHHALFSETRMSLPESKCNPVVSHLHSETDGNTEHLQANFVPAEFDDTVSDRPLASENTSAGSNEELKKIMPMDSPTQFSQTRIRRRVVMLEDNEDDNNGALEDKDYVLPKLESVRVLNPVAKSEKARKVEDKESKTGDASDTNEKEPYDVKDVPFSYGGNGIKPDVTCDRQSDLSTDESVDDEVADDEYVSDSEDTEEASDEEIVQALELKGSVSQSGEKNPKERRKRFRVDDFLDEEAELSGDENERAFYMDDEDDEVDDEDLADLQSDDDDDPNLPSAGRLRRQIERVHNRLQTDQDQRELRFLKELYLEDGDLYAEDGRTRQRRFRWRGLENEDPLADTSDLVEGGDNDGGSEDDDAAAAVSRFGPMDRWLQNAPRVSQGQKNVPHAIIDGTRASDVDLDDKPNPDDISTLTVSDEGDDGPVDNGSDDEKENRGTLAHNETNSLSVLSLGRKAFLRAQTSETKIVIQTLHNKKNSQKSITPTSTISSGATTITCFFSKQPSPLTSSIITGVHSQPSGIKTVDPNVPFLSTGMTDSRPKLSKCGSLLNRVPVSLTSKSSIPSRSSFVGTADIDLDVNVTSEDSDVSAALGERRSSTGHFFGLRNKVGLSCFNILSQPEPGTNSPRVTDSNLQQKGRSSQQLTRPFETGKRASCDSASVSLKRPRSASVFSALM